MNGLPLGVALTNSVLAQASPGPQSPGLLPTLVPLLLIVVVMYFLMIRPQQRKQKAHQAMIASLKPGDEVVTMGGIYGTVAGMDEKKGFLYLKISGDIKVKVERHAVSRVVKEDQ